MKKLFLPLLMLVVTSWGELRAQTYAPFPYVQIPSYIADGAAADQWLAMNFWNNYPFDRADEIFDPNTPKVAFLHYLDVLYATDPVISAKAIEGLLGRAAATEDGYWHILEVAETILYDPSSPARNDLLWEPFLRHAVGAKSPLDEASKVRYRTLLALVSRNQQGSLANDFVYTLPDGRQGRLHSIKSPYLLLYFYNPGCSECARTKAQIEASGLLEVLRSRGLLKVLAIHPDSDLSEWRKYLKENPEWWISSYDKGEQIRSRDLYDLKAIPTLYLLDAQKTVLMKDPTVEDLLMVLDGIARSK